MKHVYMLLVMKLVNNSSLYFNTLPEFLWFGLIKVCIPYFFGYKTEFFPSKTIPKI